MKDAELAGIYETIKGANDEQAEGKKEHKPAKKAVKKREEKHEARVEKVLHDEVTPICKRRQRAAAKGINYADESEMDPMPDAQAV